MPDYGWAYINLDVLKTIAGPTGSIQIKLDDTTLSGSKRLAFATASNKVGIGLDFPTVLPAYQLDIAPATGQQVAMRVSGDMIVSGTALVSGNLNVSGTIFTQNIHAETVISSSHLIIRDPVIGLGFGDGGALTGAVGDRGFIFGLAGNNNQAIIWDQTSGSFVFGKVGSQGPGEAAFDITDADLGEVRLSALSASTTVSGALGEFGSLSIGGSTITTVVDVSGTPADNQIAIFTDANTIEGSSKLTFDGSSLKVDAPISGSGYLEIVGDSSLGGKLSVSGSSLLEGAAKFNSSISGSGHLEIVGATTLGSTLSVSGSSLINGAAIFKSSISGSSHLEIVGATTLGSTLSVSGTIKAPNIGAGEDNSVVILDSDGTLKTDEADSRIFGSTLVDASGTPADNQLAIWTDANTVEGSSKLTFDGSLLKVDSPLSASGHLEIVGDSTLGGSLNVSGSSLIEGAAKFKSSISGSGHLEVVGDSTLGGKLSVSGSSLLNGAAVFKSSISGSGHLEIVGAAVFGNTVNVSGTLTVSSKVEHAGDTDTYIEFTDDNIEFKVGNVKLLDLAEGSDNVVTVGNGGDVDFQVKTNGNNHTIFTEGSTDRIGLGMSSPQARLHMSSSTKGMAKPLLNLEHPGAQSEGNASDGKPILFVTGTTPDGFAGAVCINGDSPAGVLDVRGAGNTALVATAEGKVMIGHGDGATPTLDLRSSLNTGQIASFKNAQTTEGGQPYNIFFISGSGDGSGKFGSDLSGSDFTVSGSSHLSDVRVSYKSKNHAASPYDVTPSDYIINCDVSGGTMEIRLPAGATAGAGRMLIVKDHKASANSNNITIKPNGSEKIDRHSSYIISEQSGSAILFCDGTDWYIAAKR